MRAAAQSATPFVDNKGVPFTLAHAAAALPFQRTRLIPSALVMGTFAPDFEYFLRFAPLGPFGHTLRGALEFSLPAALVVLWLFHRFVKMPLTLILPDSIQSRLVPYLGRFRFSGVARFALIVVSILVGIATHIAWDSFTHPNTWLYYQWPFLSQTVDIPLLGPVRHCRVLQYISSVVGIGLLLLWAAPWHRTAKPSDEPLEGQLTSSGRTILLAIAPAIAVIAGILRAGVGAKLARPHHSLERIAGEAVVTMIAIAWWELVLCGFLISRPLFSKLRVSTRTG